jgi:hypothetical protein
LTIAVLAIDAFAFDSRYRKAGFHLAEHHGQRINHRIQQWLRIMR